jgi:SAM-dependent methyltransferase/uncharacterized protein YbaR (Trm112 family)
MDEWLRKNLICPRDHRPLQHGPNVLVCKSGHQYNIVDGIPIMLLAEVPHTLWVGNASLETPVTAQSQAAPRFFLETLGIPVNERVCLSKEESSSSVVDPVVRYMIQATSGNLYKPLLRTLPSYPVPELRLPEGKEELFLDIGCNWGRWSIAAARKGYRVVGIDPSLGAIAAARRVSAQLGVSATYIVADSRFLPFPATSFDVVFSYSVFQHFSRDDVRTSLKEVGRVLKTEGTSLIQMANMFGLRSFTHQVKRGFREARSFEVRYWAPSSIKEIFDELVGNSSLEVDGYFGLGIQRADVHLLPVRYRFIVYLSEMMRTASRGLPWLSNLADSLYVRSERVDGRGENSHTLQLELL